MKWQRLPPGERRFWASVLIVAFVLDWTLIIAAVKSGSTTYACVGLISFALAVICGIVLLA